MLIRCGSLLKTLIAMLVVHHKKWFNAISLPESRGIGPPIMVYHSMAKTDWL